MSQTSENDLKDEVADKPTDEKPVEHKTAEEIEMRSTASKEAFAKDIHEILDMIATLRKTRQRRERESESESEPDSVRPGHEVCRSIGQVKKKVQQHCEQSCARILARDNRVDYLFFIKHRDDDDEIPGSLFIVSRLDKKPVNGSRFDFNHDRHQITVSSETFQGVALEIILEDIEEEGFRPAEDLF